MVRRDTDDPRALSREERQKAQLKANIAKRKEQARARSAAQLAASHERDSAPSAQHHPEKDTKG